MSKEFEELVLKKLGNLEVNVKDTNQRLGKLETEVKDTKNNLKDLSTNVNQRLGKLEVEVKDNNQRLGKLETEVKDTKNELKDLATNVNQRLGKLEIEVKDTGEVVKDIRQRFIKFDYEINKKIDTLFDANTVNLEKHTSFEKKISSLDSETFNHDIRISNLEDRVLTA